jgi:hypothetical protein
MWFKKKLKTMSLSDLKEFLRFKIIHYRFKDKIIKTEKKLQAKVYENWDPSYTYWTDVNSVEEVIEVSKHNAKYHGLEDKIESSD